MMKHHICKMFSGHWDKRLRLFCKVNSMHWSEAAEMFADSVSLGPRPSNTTSDHGRNNTREYGGLLAPSD